MTELGPSPLAAGEDNISVDAARAAIMAALQPCAAVLAAASRSQTLPLLQALGRVLAADVVSPIDVPAHDNSAMDGYAFDGAVLASTAAAAAGSPAADIQLRAVGAVFAGRPYEGRVGSGECIRIMTGAVIPAGLDTVVPIELCRVDNDSDNDSDHDNDNDNDNNSASDGDIVCIAPGAVRRGDNRRHRGEDLAVGQVALHAGRVLGPADLGLLASLGLSEIAVRPRLRVALFSTGDEVLEPGQPLAPGCIYDSNRVTLAAALHRLGMEVIDLGLVRDDPAALEATLHRAVAQADVVVTSGGVSAGDADHTRDLLARLGSVNFWKVAMRPGRPFAFGNLRDSVLGTTGRSAWLFALPGNPVAALVSFYALAVDGLLTLAGAQAQATPRLQARCAVAIRKRPGRTEFQRGSVTRAADGVWQVQPFGAQGAGILRSMSESNALIVLGHDQGAVPAGGMVEVWLFDGLV